MHVSTIFLKISHSSIRLSLSSTMEFSNSELMIAFLDANSLMLCLNFTSRASFSNLMVSIVSSIQILRIFSDGFSPSLCIFYHVTICNYESDLITYCQMGNYYCCKEYDEYIPYPSKDKNSKMKRKLIQSMEESSFKEVCVRTVQRYYDHTRQPQKEEVLRTSIVSFIHYENNNLNQCINEDTEFSNTVIANNYQPASSFSSLPTEKKQHELLKIIMESYLFLDFSDCMDNHQSYDRFMRHQLTQGDSSLDGSFLEENTSIISHLEEQLKNFNPELISKLQSYVKFCRKVKYDFAPEKGRFLGKLSLNLQSEIIQKYANKEFRKNQAILGEMFADITAILKVLIATVRTMYDFQLDQQQNISVEDQLFNSVNIYTMITSILFESENFALFIINKIKLCFKHRFNHYNSEADYTTTEFINDFIVLNSKESRRESKRSNSTATQGYSFKGINIFVKSRKFLEKIFKKHVPLFKLKVIYELSQQISKQLSDLKKLLSQKFNIEVTSVFNRQTELLVIKWLLQNHTTRIDDICAHLFYTYQLVHRMHLLDKKGSCLITFMHEIERIFQWVPA